MFKEQYEKLYNSMKENTSYEDLFIKYRTLSEIETKDRSTADGFLSGMDAADFGQLFAVFEELKVKHSYRKTAELYDLLQKCQSHWKSIQDFLEDMSDNERTSKAEKKMIESIQNAKNPQDHIGLD